MPANITFEVEDENTGEEVECTVVMRYEVCDACLGEGVRTNPSIYPDGGGFTVSEWEEACDGDPAFRDNYLSGAYDVTCKECDGNRVVPVPDEESTPVKTLRLYYEYERSKAEFMDEEEHLRALGY